MGTCPPRPPVATLVNPVHCMALTLTPTIPLQVTSYCLVRWYTVADLFFYKTLTEARLILQAQLLTGCMALGIKHTIHSTSTNKCNLPVPVSWKSEKIHSFAVVLIVIKPKSCTYFTCHYRQCLHSNGLQQSLP